VLRCGRAFALTADPRPVALPIRSAVKVYVGLPTTGSAEPEKK
jgi:hypothetical protein